MKLDGLKAFLFKPKAIVVPGWLRKLLPLNKLMYCERTYSNDYTSNTWTIVALTRCRAAEPTHAVVDGSICRAIVYAASTMQSTCLGIKTVFSRAFWVSVVRDAKREFNLRK